jgi:NitT/TauT family transport system ATP-binding protein
MRSYEPAITLSGVTKVYSNRLVALQDFNLTVEEGQFISLVGPSGCGKSTVLRLIAGLSKMTAGAIRWGEQHSHKELAFVFQEAALMPWATVWDNVRLPLKLAKTPKSIANLAVREAIHLVDLDGFEQCYPRELSGGMKMRTSIARALVTRPEILLMDEPFGALDEMTRSRLNSDLLYLWEQKQWTVIFVTHNIYEAVYLSHRVIVMAARPGRVIAEVKIDVPHPRSEEFRTSSLFNHYCREISHALAVASRAQIKSNPL